MSSFSPEYIADKMEYVSGDVITADDFNTIINKLVHQGNNSEEWLEYLDTIGIPAAIADITGEDIQEYIQQAVEEEIQQLTADSKSRTNGVWTKKSVCFIDMAGAYTGSNPVCNYCIPSQTDTPPLNPVYSTYAGSAITSMTAEQRASDGGSLSTWVQSKAPSTGVGKYIVTTANTALDKTYLVGNYLGVLYNYSGVTLPTVYDVLNDINNIPMIDCTASTGVVEDVLDAMTLDSFVVIKYSSNNTDIDEVIASIAETVDVYTLRDYITKLTRSFANGTYVYKSYNTKGRLLTYDNVYDGAERICIETLAGTFSSITPYSCLTQDDLHYYTATENGFEVTKSDGTILFTYTAPTITVDDTLVGNTTIPDELAHPIVVASSRSGESAPSYIADNVSATNDSLWINGKKVPVVWNYSSATGVLILGI